MTVGDVLLWLEAWAPGQIAWERDNVGLQVGNPREKVRGILIALDVTEAVVQEARQRRANLIISHHPLLFRPFRQLTLRSETERTLRALVKGNIHVCSAHTNLDFTRGGVSFALAERLGLVKVDFLRKLDGIQCKIATFVPASHLEAVTAAMAGAGAGRIGNYEFCSFRLEGTGTFRGNEASQPFTGRKGSLERAAEVRLEMIAPAWSADEVVGALKRAHPYEEVAYDVYPLRNASDDFGMGVIGSLPRTASLAVFTARVKRSLRARAVRCVGDPKARVQTVAVCGGSGSELINDAVRAGADVFVTADMKYHGFQEAATRIAIIDPGHYETEQPVVPVIVRRLEEELKKRGERLPVYAARTITNPVRYV